jgi:hypothetical protein
MPIQLTDLETGVPVSPRGRSLTRAAVAAQSAPSLFNTQPWRWRIGGDVAQLRVNRLQQVRSVDPDGRLMILSCGVALHHALTALTAYGSQFSVDHLPDACDPDLLATVRITGDVAPPPQAVRLLRAMSSRRSDRRPFADRTVPPETLDLLRHAAEAAGAHLHVVRPGQFTTFAVAAGRAASVELADTAYRDELHAWVGDRARHHDGIPLATTVAPVPRLVPLRDFAAGDAERLTMQDADDNTEVADRSAEYVLVLCDGDEPADWLHAGEALSAVLLTATAEGLASSVLTDLVEVDSARLMLRRMLGDSGWPMAAIRIGYRAAQTAPPAAPRRSPEVS